MSRPLLEEQAGRIRLVVIYGGRSAEHEVSCISARNVVAAVDPARYDIRLVGITTGGVWLDAAEALARGLPERALPSPDDLVRALTTGPATGPTPGPTTGPTPGPTPGFTVLEQATSGHPGSGQTVVLPLVHGPMGEDGTMQGLMELVGVPYCGTGVAGSAVAMDKGLAKALAASAGIAQVRHMYLSETELSAGLEDEVEAVLGWPVFVKPANMGSSIGITRVKDPGGLRPALDLAGRYDTAVVIEEAVQARELEIGVLGWPDMGTSVPGEVKPSRDVYDFDDKYVDGAAVCDVPARIPQEVASEMSRLAMLACRALRIDSMARVDFFYEEDGRGLLLNEVNTIPGFTHISMYPKMWEASGVPYRELIDRLVSQALRRADRRSRFETGH